ncbi:MAG: tetratricopeptide repeat protein [Cyanobacteria bacterium J06641_5]
MTNYFDLISVFCGLICAQTLLQLLQHWSSFWDDRITAKDIELAQRLAVFFLVPISILLHEVGHSLATWQVGGTVSSFQWRFYWGYIIPWGEFSPAEFWWIAFSGNLVSILLGLLPIPLIAYIRKRIIAELAYMYVCVQLIYALVGYPLLSLTWQQGDWLAIYDFAVWPYALPTLIVHGVLLWGLWRLYYSPKVVDWRLSRDAQVSDKWKYLQADTKDDPNDLQLQLRSGYFLLQHKEVREAQRVGKKVARIAPDSDRVRVFQVVMHCSRRAYRKAAQLGRQLLNADLLPEDRLRLYRALCLSTLERGRLLELLSFANQGLALAPQDFMLRWYRAIAHQRTGQDRKAKADIDVALENAPDEGSRQRLRQWQKQHLQAYLG